MEGDSPSRRVKGGGGGELKESSEKIRKEKVCNISI